MDKSWPHKLFARSSKPDLEVADAKADFGDADVQFGLGFRFANGKGAAQDYVQAAEWYRKAAAQNHSLAQFNLGLMYAKGDGVSQDDAEAVMWIRKAAHLGDAGAQFNLGMRCHCLSIWGPQPGAPKSRIEAHKWLQLAAAQGYKGSAEACERAALGMTREEVIESNQGAAAFVAGKSAP